MRCLPAAFSLHLPPTPPCCAVPCRSVSKLPGKQESDQEVMLQGRLARQVAEFLGSAYGIPAAFMEVKAGKK